MQQPLKHAISHDAPIAECESFLCQVIDTGLYSSFRKHSLETKHLHCDEPIPVQLSISLEHKIHHIATCIVGSFTERKAAYPLFPLFIQATNAFSERSCK